MNDIPDITTEEFLSIIDSEEIFTTRSLKLLSKINSLPEGEANASQISKLMGGSGNRANLDIGDLGKKVAQHFELQKYLPDRGKHISRGWWQVIADEASPLPNFSWKLKPNLLEALEISNKLTSDNESSHYLSVRDIQTKKSYTDDLNSEIENAAKLTSPELEKYTKAAPDFPDKIQVQSTIFKRNAHVIVSVLRRANGVCEKCNNPAPFNRKSDQSPYLEVHHIIPLSRNGKDKVENAQALCPNCHREAHHGTNSTL